MAFRGVNTGPVNSLDYTTPLRVELRRAWAVVADDPAVGGSTGRDHGAASARRRIPRANEADVDFNAESFTNYRGIDEDQLVAIGLRASAAWAT
jgi:hypothetical protein